MSILNNICFLSDLSSTRIIITIRGSTVNMVSNTWLPHLDYERRGTIIYHKHVFTSIVDFHERVKSFYSHCESVKNCWIRCYVNPESLSGYMPDDGVSCEKSFQVMGFDLYLQAIGIDS